MNFETLALYIYRRRKRTVVCAAASFRHCVVAGPNATDKLSGG